MGQPIEERYGIPEVLLEIYIFLREMEPQSFSQQFEFREVLFYIKDTAKMYTSSLPLGERLLSGLCAGYSKN